MRGVRLPDDDPRHTPGVDHLWPLTPARPFVLSDPLTLTELIRTGTRDRGCRICHEPVAEELLDCGQHPGCQSRHEGVFKIVETKTAARKQDGAS